MNSVARVAIGIRITLVIATLRKGSIKLQLTVGATTADATAGQIGSVAVVALQASVIGSLAFALTIRPGCPEQSAARKSVWVVCPVTTTMAKSAHRVLPVMWAVLDDNCRTSVCKAHEIDVPGNSGNISPVVLA
jgi:hypothetical protein